MITMPAVAQRSGVVWTCLSLSVGRTGIRQFPPADHDQVLSSNGQTEFSLKRNSPNKQQREAPDLSRSRWIDHPLLPPLVPELHTNARQGYVRRRPLAFAFAIREPETLDAWESLYPVRGGEGEVFELL